MTQVALQRDDYFRLKYTMDVSIYQREMLVFLDETGADRRNHLRKYGYGVRGIPVQQYSLFVRGERTSAIAIMSVKGILDVLVETGSINGDKFYDFTAKYLIPQLQPFDETNPNSIVIMDNCSIHRITEIISMIEEVGAIVHFLPPYSPDLNPIELAFSKVKSNLKDMAAIDDANTIMLASFATISQQDCEGWVAHCGY